MSLANVYGNLLIVRPPVPATCNKAGANYKSEVAHTTYYPQRAFDEWVTICDAIVACGGDALFMFEASDEPYLDFATLHVDGQGDIRGDDSTSVIGNLASVETGRVFAANGPWVMQHGQTLRAVMPHMLPHRRSETSYYQALLREIANANGATLELIDNPHRWEGMADVAVVGERVVLTYAVPGHYDADTAPKSSRSSRAGVEFAADAHGVPAAARIFAELVYPHFHGDTVHFGARATATASVSGARAKLAHYSGGLWNGQTAIVREALTDANLVPIGREDAVDNYAGNSRQVGDGLLVPDGVSPTFIASMQQLGLAIHKVPLFELFGKAGGGPACATLYMPTNLEVPADAPFRYSTARDKVRQRRSRVPTELRLAPEYFEGKTRG